MPSWLPWAFFVIIGGAGYQISVKLATGTGKLPLFLYTAIIGATVLILSVGALLVQGNATTALASLSRRTVILPLTVGLFAFCIELGFFLLYSNNAPIAVGRIITMSGTGLLLLAVGVLYFHEAITPNQLAGIALTMLGLALIAYK